MPQDLRRRKQPFTRRYRSINAVVSRIHDQIIKSSDGEDRDRVLRLVHGLSISLRRHGRQRSVLQQPTQITAKDLERAGFDEETLRLGGDFFDIGTLFLRCFRHRSPHD